jgi:hypothetical protein
MDLQKQLDRLDRLRTDRNEWQQMGNRQRLCVKLDGVRITVHDDPHAGTTWQVDEPMSEHVIQPWSHANSVVDAMRESTDFTRAYLLSVAQPQHAE